MAKKKSWLNLVKWFFTSDTQEKQEKKDQRRKWIFFRRVKIKSRLASIAAPSPPRERTRRNEAEEQQSKHALNVALASAAAAEAAVAAAHAAAEVVFLTGVPQSTNKCEEETENHHHSIKIQADTTHECEKKKQERAAIKIQTTFRGYLARKALRALRGIVKLQAIIRGRNVRRQAITTLKCLQSIVNIQSQASARRIQMAERPCNLDENKELQNLRDKIIKMDTSSQRGWNGSILTKEEADAMFLSRKEAAIKRERIKEYAFTHRNSAETERNKVNGRWRYWLDQWVDTQVSKSKELEDLDSVLTSNPKPRVEYRGKQLKLRGLQKQYQTEGMVDSPITAPRRSFHRKQCSLGGEENSFSMSPVVVPTYMAATESAKAKLRSVSSPKLRPTSSDAYFDSYSPSKNKLSLMSSSTTEAASSGRPGIGKPGGAYQQRSPSLKGLPGPVKSNLTLKDLSFDSECSFRTWNHQSTFR